MSRPLDPRLIRQVPALRRYLALLVGCQLAAAGLIVAQAGLLAAIIGSVFAHRGHVPGLAAFLVGLAAVGLGRSAVSAVQEYAAARASVRVRVSLRAAALHAMVRRGPAWVQDQPSGRLVNASGPGLDGLDGYLTRALPAVVSACVVPVVVVARIGVADWQSAVLLLIMVPLVPLFMALVGITTRRRVEHQYLLLSRLAGQFLDLLRGLTTLTVYGQARRQERTLQEATDRYRRVTLSSLRIAFLSGLVLDLVATLSVAVIAVDVGLRLDSGRVALTTALVVLLLAPELFEPLRALGVQYHATAEGTTAAAAALDVIGEPSVGPSQPSPVPSTSPVPVPRAAGSVLLRDVTVRHPGRGADALSHVSLSLAPGELVALRGPSGAGKSTLLAVLLGFVAPTSGEVEAGTGRGPTDDGAGTGPDAWRRRVAWLPQRPVPSQPTVADEIRLGDPAASEQTVDLACRRCRTPAPATVLGEDGRWVSAGQRRRVAMARVLVRAWSVRAAGGVPLVLLDEPSEDLDRATEQVIADVIAGLAGWATVVVATHSATLVELADRVVTLEAGEVRGDVRAPAGRAVRASSTVSELPVAEPSSPHAQPPVTDARPDVDAAAGDRARRRWQALLGGATDSGVRRRLVLAGALSGLAGLTGLGLTATSMWLISRAAQHPNVQALAIAVVGVRTFAIARALLRYGERLAAHDGALRLLTALRVSVFAALRPRAVTALGGFGRGDLLRRFVGDVDGVQDGLVRAFVPLVGAVVTAAGAVALAGLLVPAAATVLAAALVLAALLGPWLTGKAVGDTARLAELAGRRDAGSAAVVDAMPELVAYGAATPAVERVTGLDDEVCRRSVRGAAAGAFGTLFASGAGALALPGVLLAGARAVRLGQLDPVNLAVLAVCVLTAFAAVNPLPGGFAAWARCRSGLDRVAEILAAPPAVAEPAVPAPVPVGRIGVAASGLRLAPAAGARAVLTDADLLLAAGTRVAVAGASGSGKSTLLAAVLRLIPAGAGRLGITGADGIASLAQLRADDMPPLAAGSLQGDHVFGASLRDNLRVVRPAATDRDLDEVGARAGLADFVAGLPAGWSTPVGPDGASLSGGQRQRLLLARALLADPQVLVLDEPTAHLDADTERRVLADLLDATAGRTVLLSTHRRLRPGQVDATVTIEQGRLQRASDHAGIG